MGKSKSKVAERKAGLAAPADNPKARGNFYDLQEIFDELNQEYFHNKIVGGKKGVIRWGNRRRSGKWRSHKTIRMGCNKIADKLIIIHTALDRCFVPRWFIKYIVYHEMLHQVVRVPMVKGHRQFHTPEFFAEERKYKHYKRAKRWENEHIDFVCYH